MLVWKLHIEPGQWHVKKKIYKNRPATLSWDDYSVSWAIDEPLAQFSLSHIKIVDLFNSLMKKNIFLPFFDDNQEWHFVKYVKQIIFLRKCHVLLFLTSDVLFNFFGDGALSNLKGHLESGFESMKDYYLLVK
jgi:hypothetical protein